MTGPEMPSGVGGNSAYLDDKNFSASCSGGNEHYGNRQNAAHLLCAAFSAKDIRFCVIFGTRREFLCGFSRGGGRSFFCKDAVAFVAECFSNKSRFDPELKMAGFFSLVFVDKRERIRYTVYEKQEQVQDIVLVKTAFRNWWNGR